MTLVTSSYSDLCDLAFRERAWADSGSPPLPSPSPSPVCGWTKSRHRTEITRFQTICRKLQVKPLMAGATAGLWFPCTLRLKGSLRLSIARTSCQGISIQTFVFSHWFHPSNHSDRHSYSPATTVPVVHTLIPSRCAQSSGGSSKCFRPWVLPLRPHIGRPTSLLEVDGYLWGNVFYLV